MSHLTLRNFRNYEALDVELGPGFYVVAGPNAQGKTNLLEALHFLSTTRLLRGIRETEAIREGCEKAAASAEIGSTAAGLTLEHGSKKRAYLNGMSLPRAADLIGRIPSVCVSAFDMEIVRGEPAERRLFLDMELSQRSPGYLRHFAAYKRAVDQRGALLRAAHERYVAGESFEPWEAQIAFHGSAMRAQRIEATTQMATIASEAHDHLGAGELLQVTYVMKDEAVTAEELEAALHRSRETDIHRKSTSVGPHRDDLSLLIDGKDARAFGSQGQQRSLVLSLKFAAMEMQRQLHGDVPLLLLDDILSDLDASRRSRLSEWVLQHARQAVLTCTEPEAVGPAILNQAAVYQVQAGRISIR